MKDPNRGGIQLFLDIPCVAPTSHCVAPPPCPLPSFGLCKPGFCLSPSLALYTVAVSAGFSGSADDMSASSRVLNVEVRIAHPSWS